MAPALLKTTLAAQLALALSGSPQTPTALPDACSSVNGKDTLSYTAADGSDRRSTLRVVRDQHGQQLHGVTQLEDGSCLIEEANLDPTGRLLRAESNRAGDRILLDARAGTVDITTQGVRRTWTIDTDLPWIWIPQLDDTRSLATPLAALATWRAAHSHQALRLIDLAHAESHTILTDQLLVPECPQSDLVVIGDEAVTIRRGVPQHWHSSSFSSRPLR